LFDVKSVIGSVRPSAGKSYSTSPSSTIRSVHRLTRESKLAEQPAQVTVAETIGLALWKYSADARGPEVADPAGLQGRLKRERRSSNTTGPLDLAQRAP
jgi:hypothetical protein